MLLKARTLLENITPLEGDCGRLCGAACCASLAGEETGMLLFPGEAALYEGMAGFRVLPASAGELLICNGQCSRAERPLACRLFPLLPVVRRDGIRVAMDRRARAVCPLTRQGISALNPAFVEAVRQAGQLLAQNPAQLAFLERLTQAQDDLSALGVRFGAR